MKGFEFILKLTKTEQVNFYKEMQTQSEYNLGASLQWEVKDNSMVNFLLGSFDFKKSIKGLEYWNKVAKKY